QGTTAPTRSAGISRSSGSGRRSRRLGGRVRQNQKEICSPPAPARAGRRDEPDSDPQGAVVIVFGSGPAPAPALVRHIEAAARAVAAAATAAIARRAAARRGQRRARVAHAPLV